MNATRKINVTIDKAGRLVLPKPMRDALHLKPGSSIEVEQREDSITLRSPRPEVELVKKNGMWVVKHNHPLTHSIPDLIAKDREDRIQTLIRRSMGEEEAE
jgi:AbrB family looped-hinge helix DNA binding protein